MNLLSLCAPEGLRTPFFIWDCKGSTFFLTSKTFFNFFSKAGGRGGQRNAAQRLAGEVLKCQSFTELRPFQVVRFSNGLQRYDFFNNLQTFSELFLKKIHPKYALTTSKPYITTPYITDVFFRLFEGHRMHCTYVCGLSFPKLVHSIYVEAQQAGCRRYIQ